MPRYRVWNNSDPNVSFEVEAQDSEQAAYFALSELDYSVSAEPIKEEGEGMEFVKEASIDGTSLVGYIEAKYYKLVELFGEPEGSDGYKTDAEWSGTLDGVVFTIYNWKDGKNYCGAQGQRTEDITQWNVGGHSSEALRKVKEFLFLNQ